MIKYFSRNPKVSESYDVSMELKKGTVAFQTTTYQEVDMVSPGIAL